MSGTPGLPGGEMERAELPPIVQRYLERVLPAGQPQLRHARLTQVGEMWQKPGGRPLRFTAVQEFAVGEIAFSWRARFPIAPLVWLQVVDRYEAGEGELAVGVWGALPLSRDRGPDVDKGEASRYLMELPWVPQAMLANAALEWRELEDSVVEVATAVGGERVAVHLRFDADGDIASTHAPVRPRRDSKRTLETPCTGEVGDYRVFDGVRIPTRAEVRWDLPEGPFTYFRGSVTSLVTE